MRCLFLLVTAMLLTFHGTQFFAEEQPLLDKGYKIIEDTARLPIKTPTFSERKVLKIQLENGLQALLISDPKTDQSAATITVGAGSWEDPDAYPGIAHFLEHMLFLGTKKYPLESEYQSFISQHGGYTNAFTTSDYTAYMFSVDNEAFPAALDRFAHFFKEPLFNPSGVSRELNAIDQEYAKNYENDDIREVMVLKGIENPKHPNYRFTMGNSSTLSSVSQETLKQWYADHYSSNLMRLFVVSNLPMEDLVKMTVEDFGEVPNRHKSPFIPEMPLSNPALEGKYIYIEPIKNVRTLTLAWDLPPEFSEMKDTRPDRLICHVLGHEGEESLLAELKRAHLAESIGCNTFEIGGKNLILLIEVELTDEGVQQIDQVILRCFQTIALMRKNEFPQSIFDEVKQVNTIEYEYQKREDAFTTAMKNAELLNREDLSSYPEKSYIIQKFNPKDVSDLLNFMTPQNGRFLIKAPTALTGVQPNQEEPWLHVRFAIKPIPSEKMKEWSEAQPIAQIRLPVSNPFLPQTLELYHKTILSEKELPLVPSPELILNNERGTVYYAPDQRYQIPKLYLYFNIKTPSIDKGNPTSVVFGDLYVKALEEILNQFSYPATVAGLDYSVDRSDFGITIKLTGYNDKAVLLFDEIVKKLKEQKIPESKFKLYKQSLLRQYHNFNKETPLKRVKELFHSIAYKDYVKEAQKAVALRKLSFAKFNEELQHLFDKTFVEGIVYGNVTHSQAEEFTEKLLKSLSSEPYPKRDQKKSEVIVLPNEGGPFIYETKISAQGNAALLAIEYPEYNFKSRAAQQVLMTAMNEPFFSDLRTKQQTGYLVFSAGEEIERKLFNAFAVQSNTHDPRDLLARFELFIENFLQEMGKTFLTPESFETIKASLLHDLEKPQNNLEAMGDLLQTLAFKYEGRFDWIDQRIKGLKELTYPEFLKFSKEFMGKNNRRRLGLLVKGNQNNENVLDYSKIPDINQLKKLSTFSPAF